MASLGSSTAWIKIAPNADSFGPEAKALVSTALDRIDGSVAVQVDQAKLGASVSAAAAKIGTLKGAGADVQKTLDGLKATVDTTPAEARLTALRSKIDVATKRAATFKIDADDKIGQAKILEISSRIDTLGKKVAKPGVDPQLAEASYLRIDAALDKLARDRTVHIKVAESTSAASKATGALGALGSLGGSAGGSGGSGASKAAAGGISDALSTPEGAIAAVGAGLAGLPFIAQAAAGGIVFALGAGLAAIPIAGALQNAKVQKSFSNLGKSAKKDLGSIGTSFVPVMQSIAKTASGVLGSLTPVFAGAAKTISGPFASFSQALLKTFKDPAVKSSISDVAGAFGKLLDAITPSLGGDVDNIADGISAIAKAVGSNPGAFRDFVDDLSKVAGGALDIIAALTKVASWVERNWDWVGWIVAPEVLAIEQAISHWDGFQHEVAVIFDGVRSETAKVWDDIYGGTVGVAIRIGHDIETQFDSLRHSTANIWDGLGGDADKAWNDLYGGTVGVAIRIGHDVEADFDDLRHSTANIFDGVRSDAAGIWNGAYADVTGFALKIWHDAVADFNSLRSGAVNIWNGFRSDAASVWNGAYADVTGFARKIWTDAVGDFNSLRTGAVGVWNGFRSDAASVWGGFYGDVTGIAQKLTGWFSANIESFFTKTVPGWFGTAVSGVATAWDVVSDTVKKPIVIVVNDVLDPLIRLIDNVLSFVKLGTIDTITLAQGGTVSGQGAAGRDSVHAMLAPGELVIPTSHAAAFGDMARKASIPGFSGGGAVQGFAAGGVPGGGVISDVVNGVKTAAGDVAGFFSSLFSKLGDTAGFAVDLATGNGTAAVNELTKLTGVNAGGAGGEFASALLAIPGQLIGDAVKFLLSPVQAFAKSAQTAAAGTSGNVASFKPIVDAVLKALGQPVADDAIALSQMQTESGGNVNAVNLTDINAQNGTPSVGLMQVIAPTFDAYAGPYKTTGPFLYGVSTNPQANVYAGLNYAVHRYPDWTSVLGQGHGYSGGGVVGMANGGVLNEPVFGVGASGQRYSFAEHGSEAVIPLSGATSASGDTMTRAQGERLIQRLEQLIAVGQQQPRSYAKALSGSLAQGTRRGYFATSG